MGWLKKLGSSESGFLVVSTLYTLLLVVVIGMAFMLLSRTELLASADYRDGIAAQYIAESGVKQAIAELTKNKNWRGVLTEMVIGPGYTGRYKVKAEYLMTGGVYEIFSIGTVNKARRMANVKMRFEQTDDAADLFTIPRIILWINY